MKLGSKQKTVRLTKYESATELCRALSPAIIEKVMRIIDTGKNEMAIVKAAELLLNRAYGKPFQPMAEMKEVVPPTINVTFPDSGKVFSTTITPEITTQLNNPKPSRSSETDIIREALTEDSDS